MSTTPLTQKLDREFNSALTDAEALISATAAVADENVGRLRTKARQSVSAAKEKLADATESVRARARDAADVFEARVREEPWKVVGAAAVMGLVAGIIVGASMRRA